MQRILLLALAVLAIAHPAAWGQVAAPSLIPATPGVVDPTLTKDPTVVPTNPAVLGWPTPSRVATGLIRADRGQERVQFKSSAGTVLFEQPSHSSHYEGSHAGGLYQNGRYGIAASSLAVRDVTTSSAPLDDFRHKVAIGVNLGGAFAAGAGYHFDSDRQDNSHQRTTGYSAGASFRFADHFYLGGGAGVDHLRRRSINSAGSDGDGTSRVSIAGLGYLSDGTVRLHIEAWGGTISGSGSGTQSQSAQVQSATIEAKYRSLVAGVAALGGNGNFAADDSKFDLAWGESEVSIGVVSDHGFGVLYHYGFGSAKSKARFSSPAGSVSAAINSASKAQSLTVVWQY